MTVDHPDYYRKDTGHEAIDVIEAWGLGFNLGNALKYIARAGMKGDAVEDLEKAAWYVQREIQRRTPSPPARPHYRVCFRRGHHVILDEDGDAMRALDEGEAQRLAATLRWAVDQADYVPASIFEDGPKAWRAKDEGSLIHVEDDVVRLEGLTDEEADELADALEAGA